MHSSYNVYYLNGEIEMYPWIQWSARFGLLFGIAYLENIFDE